MQKDAAQTGAPAVAELRVNGGACVNDLLMQFQADLLGIDVIRPVVTETAAPGAASLAGLSTVIFKNTDEPAARWEAQRRIEPRMAAQQAPDWMARWEHAVHQTVA